MSLFTIFSRAGLVLTETQNPRAALENARYLADQESEKVEIWSDGRARLIAHPGGLFEKAR